MIIHDDEIFVRNLALVLLGLFIVAVIALLLARKVDQYFDKNVVDSGDAISNEPSSQIRPAPKTETPMDTLPVRTNSANPLAPERRSPDDDPRDTVPAAAAGATQRVKSGLTASLLADGVKGKEVFDAACYVCHTPGAGGSPKLGDAAAWRPRVSKGIESLYHNAINGYMGKLTYMPPKGGRPDFSEEEVKAAVDYMVSRSK